jgi:polysaccharide pyruvyl transferase WcaK-like protein
VLRSIFIGVPSELYRWFEALKTLWDTDVLIIPGTGLLTDAYCITGWGPYSSFKWSSIAKMRGCKVLFVSVGVGPLYGRLGRLLVKSALALADWRSYRDASSLRYLKSIGFVSPADRNYPDLAFSLPPALFTQNGNKKHARSVVGLGLMEYAGRYSVANPTSKTFRNYLDNLVVFVEWLLLQDYNVRLLIGDLCDRPAVQEFQRLLKERLPAYGSDRIVAEPIDSVDDLLLQLSRSDLVVATRFHNVLLALLSNKPTIAISFHHKCASLMSAMGLSEYCVDINDFKADELIGKFCDLEKNAEQLKSSIRERAQSFREELDEQYEHICRQVSK